MHFRPLRLACPTLGTMHQMDKRFMHDRDEDCGNLLRRVPFFRPGQGSRSRRAGVSRFAHWRQPHDQPWGAHR